MALPFVDTSRAPSPPHVFSMEELAAATEEAGQQNPSAGPPTPVAVGGVTYSITVPSLSVEASESADEQTSAYQEHLHLLAQSSSLQGGLGPLFTPQEQPAGEEGATAMVLGSIAPEPPANLPPIMSFMTIWGCVDAHKCDPVPFTQRCFIIEIDEPKPGTAYDYVRYHFLCHAPEEGTAGSIRPVRITGGVLSERYPDSLGQMGEFILMTLWNTFGWPR